MIRKTPRPSRAARHTAGGPALVGLILLAGCSNPPTSPTAPAARAAIGAGTSPGPAPAAVAAGPVTRFDGRYTGTLTLNPDRTRACAAAPAETLEITVRQGRGSFLVNPLTRQTLTGTVGGDGSIRLADTVDRSVATSGVFNAEGFAGEHRNGPCSYAVNFRRQG